MSPTPVSVLMVSASFFPHVGGAEKQALELSVALARRGVKVQVATRRRRGLPSGGQVRGVPVHRLFCFGPGLLNAGTFLFSLAAFLILRRHSYDIIHVHLAGSPALAACWIGQALGKPVFVKLGGGRGVGEISLSRGTWAGRLKLRWLSRIKPRFFAVTSDIAAEARQALGDPTVEIVPNGVDTDLHHPVSPLERAALRTRVGWPEAPLGFLYTGRLSAEKSLPRFLETWARVTAECFGDAFMAFAGEGPEEGVLRQTAARLGLEGRVFFHGAVEDVHWLYAAADVFVLPSRAEGLSNSLLEALASGLPVIASRVGGNAEYLEEGRTGLLFDPGNPVELELKIKAVLERADLRRELGRRGRELAETRFSLKALAERYKSFYRESLARG
ncbi:MAG: glycosyltransferase family 4 protein [Elusimicrobia bacterium]|nr:glycosyltransferase family 4 protein [Elusimicrobiota bacterium]